MSATTADIRDLLKKRYPSPEWAFMEEVAPATGGGTRYADAVAVNLWASRGHAIHGFEVKVSRHDWQRELKSPEKSEPIQRYCDHWWIVAPKDIVKDGELPPTWGLIELRGSSLVQRVGAPALKPQSIDLGFFASLMRRAHEQIDAIADLKLRRAVSAARAQIDEEVQTQVARRSREFERTEAALKKLKDATGIDIDGYSGPPIHVFQLAQKLDRLIRWGGEGKLQQLTDLADQLNEASQTVRAAVEAFEAAATPAQAAA